MAARRRARLPGGAARAQRRTRPSVRHRRARPHPAPAGRLARAPGRGGRGDRTAAHLPSGPRHRHRGGHRARPATLATALGTDELRLLRTLCADGPDGEDLWFTRFWAAKEAVAKAEGVGFGGRPGTSPCGRPPRTGAASRSPGGWSAPTPCTARR
ncbi:4'-phosphopantetheinyl transferase superfamily protein [Streptomyces diastatochromogenes]|nr:4'-phosphopantetheinyl transferase superfamily protein [Streptomyces diastatochromogenes]